jgi:hypothetical protein
MIHWAYNFCAAVEQLQATSEADLSLVEATLLTAEGMNTSLILKTRDSLRELAERLELIAVSRTDEK